MLLALPGDRAKSHWRQRAVQERMGTSMPYLRMAWRMTKRMTKGLTHGNKACVTDMALQHLPYGTGLRPMALRKGVQSLARLGRPQHVADNSCMALRISPVARWCRDGQDRFVANHMASNLGVVRALPPLFEGRAAAPVWKGEAAKQKARRDNDKRLRKKTRFRPKYKHTDVPRPKYQALLESADTPSECPTRA